MRFKNETDNYFTESLERFDVNFEIIQGANFDSMYLDLKNRFGKLFSLKPISARDVEGIPCFAYRTQGAPFFTAFYAVYKKLIGGPLYVLTEIRGEPSDPDTIFKLSSSAGLAASHGYLGGVDHICFTSDFLFTTIRDQNDIIIGYGKAIECVREFRDEYPEFVV
ncbi:hypothetical protein ACFSOZ_10080 [Mesorhizobium newzealandense]|uniref:Uncharacterized protein n=1 Tax=Mesorhizobium newzealandense TaxID=1300302 RepID=A0ABW4U9P4_9HYPH